MQYYRINKKNNEEELQHYGVIGMKWRFHRQANIASKIGENKKKLNNKETSNRKKAKAQKKIAKLKAKDARIQKVLDRRTTSDTQKRVKKMDTGDAIVQSILLSSYGALKYNSEKAKGKSTIEAGAKGLVSAYANGYTLSIMEHVTKL